MNRADVIIIGAGVSGLAAAKALEKQGFSYEIIEKSGHPGGRIKTVLKDGFTLDVGFQVLHPNYTEVQDSGVLEKLDFRSFQSGALFSKEKSLTWYGNPFLDIKGFIKSGFSNPFPVKELPAAFRIFRDAWLIKEDFQNSGFGEDCMTYIKNKGIGEKTIHDFFLPFFGGVFLDQKLGAGKNYFLWLLKKFMFGKPGLPEGGMQRLPMGLAGSLPADRKFHFSTEVSNIENSIVFAKDGRQFEGKYIIDTSGSALPAGVKFHSTRNIYLAGNFCENLPISLIINGNQEGNIIHFCFPSALHPSHAPEGKSLVSITMKIPEKEVSKDAIIKELSLLYSKINWSTWELLESFYIRNAVPAHRETNGKMFQSAGNIYRCGDAFSYPSINGAMRSGREAAEEIIQKLRS